MPISLKLPAIDNNPVLLAETRASKISEFIQNLPYGDPISAATNLIDELQILNGQKVAYATRLHALELYRPAAIRIYKALIPYLSNTSLPISKNEQAFADAAAQLWQEFAYGYKLTLIDLQSKILNLNSSKSTANVVQRVIHAFKEIALIHHLTYRSLPGALWTELHQVYFCAVQQGAEKLEVAEPINANNVSTVNLVYAQFLLMALSDPQHLATQEILNAEAYLSSMAHLAELKLLGLVDTPTSVFLVELDSNKPPTPFAKNRDIPDDTTDILFITLNLARQIHQHIKLLQEGNLPTDARFPEFAIEHSFEDLLTHLIKNFGRAPQRIFSRTKKSDGIELGIGISATHRLISGLGGNDSLGANALKPSRWQVLNVSAGGFSLRKFNSSQTAAQIGDVVAMKNNNANNWELAVLRWANVNDLSQLDVGLQLVSPSATAVSVKSQSHVVECEALLLPELSALKQLASIIMPRGFCRLGETIAVNNNHTFNKILVTKLVERTASFERFQYRLI
jgi:cyclic-di-GMP-binding protein